MSDVVQLRAYLPIPPESWGSRLGRVCDKIAGISGEEAAERAGQYMRTTKQTVHRLEALDEEPTGQRQRSRRQLAYVLCAHVYHVDPAEFGLGDDDVPPALRATEVAVTSTKWDGAIESRRLRLAA